MAARRRPRRPGEKGLALAETLVVAATLAVSVLGLTQVAVTTAWLRRANNEKQVAAQTLVQQLDLVQATPFVNITATHDGQGFDATAAGAANAMLRPLPNDADGQPGQITVTAPGGAPGTLLEITARLDWLGPSGPQNLSRSIRLARLGALQ